VLAATLAFFVGGCSSVGASAVRTGPQHAAPYAGPVALHALGDAPSDADLLGTVEAYGSEHEGNIETLIPVFTQKVAQLGGNAAVIDGVRTEFSTYLVPYTESYSVPCGLGATCVRTRTYLTNQEVMRLTVYGRAFALRRSTP
jgi:hypothetical protein